MDDHEASPPDAHLALRAAEERGTGVLEASTWPLFPLSAASDDSNDEPEMQQQAQLLATTTQVRLDYCVRQGAFFSPARTRQSQPATSFSLLHPALRPPQHIVSRTAH
jgi:hypothetical protein